MVDPQGAEDPADPLPRSPRPPRAVVGARPSASSTHDAGTLADPARSSSTLLDQVGDPDLAGPAGVHPRLDGRPRCHRVDVAVPYACAPHHHDRVADARPHLFEGADGVVGRLEQVQR